MTENDKNTMWSKQSDEWSTPQTFFDELNKEFHFTLDPCSTVENHKCEKFYTMQDNGLEKSWEGETVFVNPPYSKNKQWVEKCAQEGRKEGTTVVMLIPSRTDTRWFHDFIYKKAEIRFIKGRLKFGGSKNSAPFPSMVVIFRGRKERKVQNENND